MAERPAKRRKIEKFPPLKFVKQILNSQHKKGVLQMLQRMIDPQGTITTLREILQMPRRKLKKETLGHLAHFKWWVCEKTTSPWVWWLITPGKAYFIDHNLDVYIIEDSKENFCVLYASEGSTLAEVNVVQKDRNGQVFDKWEILVNDLLIFNGASYLNKPMSGRFGGISKVVLEYRKHLTQPRYNFPFAVRGKFWAPLMHLGSVINLQRFSEQKSRWMFMDAKRRQNPTEGFIFKREDHCWVASQASESFLEWKYPPPFIVELKPNYIKNGKLQIWLDCQVDGEEGTEVMLCMENDVNEDTRKQLSERSQTMRALMYYNSSQSQMVALRLDLMAQADGLEKVMNILQSQIGMIPMAKVKQAAAAAIDKEKRRKAKHHKKRPPQ